MNKISVSDPYHFVSQTQDLIKTMTLVKTPGFGWKPWLWLKPQALAKNLGFGEKPQWLVFQVKHFDMRDFSTPFILLMIVNRITTGHYIITFQV